MQKDHQMIRFNKNDSFVKWNMNLQQEEHLKNRQMFNKKIFCRMFVYSIETDLQKHFIFHC
jgi:hypothetical protein